MHYYTKLLPWSNSARLKKLTEFRSIVTIYFANSDNNWMAHERIERELATSARIQINRALREVHAIILCSGVNPFIRYTPPPAIGGFIQNIDLIGNIFNLHRFGIPHAHSLDAIDQAIGVYEHNKRPSFLRSINPLFYIGLAFDWVARLPFVLIGRVGFNQQKIEDSRIGRIIKGIVYVFTALAAIFTVLNFLGYLAPVKAALNGVLESR